MPGGVVHEQMVSGLQHALHACEACVVDLDEVGIVEIDGRPVERAQHAVGNVGRSRIGEEVAAAGFGDGRAHALVLMGAGRASIAENADL